MPKLTLRQQQVYQFIIDYLDQHGYPPTLQEIAAHLEIRGNLGVLRHLGALEKKGYIQRTAGSSRGIVVLGRSSSLSLPIVGSIAAGPLSEALEYVEDYLSVDVALTKGADSFILRVRGDSMIEAQIADGDLAVVSPQATVDNGDIVVAMLDGEATLKRFYQEAGYIRLQPENSRLQPIILSASDGEVTILGKVTGIFRLLGS
ncbi:MAG: LexA family transcriptional regulator [Deltaproteobacteria bacterium]|nr:MAG: LexA family transcriptional regulator [Deltaproteobacteria bacterium]RLB78188.1 MAG: LexA family transcriptional regulator [Deltaproteobacteria bacterium]